jgi:hypothetical protein
VSTLIHRKMLIDRAAAVEEEIIDEEVNTSRFRK